jgi:hypothetical protein
MSAPTLSPLQILLLAVLDQSRVPITRYVAMSKLNHVYSEIRTPYSPGAVYHALGQLLGLKLITASSSGITLDATGRSELYSILLTTPLPLNPLGILEILMALQLTSDAKVRATGMQRIQVELIKNNHIQSSSQSGKPNIELALTSWRSAINRALGQMILDLGA